MKEGTDDTRAHHRFTVEIQKRKFGQEWEDSGMKSVCHTINKTEEIHLSL